MIRLYAPQEYLQASNDKKFKICNGCGPDNILHRIIPNSIFGVDVTEACNIHDWMTTNSRDLTERLHADSVFFANLKKLINKAGGSTLLRWLRVSAARLYHYSVRSYSHIKSKQ